MAMPLDGIRVIDLTTSYSAPIGTMQLADFGADVIKIENTKSGDGSRRWNPFLEGMSSAPSYLQMNRNKKSIALDLKSEEGKAILFELIKTADVVVENFRPGTVKKMGIDYEAACKVKPDIIYASLSGYGQTGPNAGNGAFSNLAEAQSGLMSIQGQPDEVGGAPTASGVAFGDSVAGMYLCQGILYAIIHHMRTGEGQYLDIAMVDGLIGLIQHGVINTSLFGEVPQRMGNRDISDYPYDAFQAKDGWCFLGNARQHDWGDFARAIGRPDLIERHELDGPDGRWAHVTEIHDIIAEWAIDKTRAEIEEIIVGHGQLFSPILDMKEVMENPQVLHREMIVDMEYDGIPYKMSGIPVKMTKTPGQIRMGCPHQGEHTDEILKEIGMTDEQLAELREKKVIK